MVAAIVTVIARAACSSLEAPNLWPVCSAASTIRTTLPRLYASERSDARVAGTVHSSRILITDLPRYELATSSSRASSCDSRPRLPLRPESLHYAKHFPRQKRHAQQANLICNRQASPSAKEAWTRVGNGQGCPVEKPVNRAACRHILRADKAQPSKSASCYRRHRPPRIRAARLGDCTPHRTA